MEDRYNVADVASGHIECAGYEWGSFIYIGIEEGWRIGTMWRMWPVVTSSVRGMSIIMIVHTHNHYFELGKITVFYKKNSNVSLSML